ncbi:MAG: hypothetical protein RTS72_06280 [Candidatus Thorarchaeota archaeon]
MEDQQTPRKKYTVGALVLHAIVLLCFAAYSFNESLIQSYPLTSGLAHLTSGFYGVLGAIAVWLAGEHYSETVRKRRLQIWASFCIVLSMYPLIAFFILYFGSPSYFSFTSLFQVPIFLIPPVLILAFVRKERT